MRKQYVYITLWITMIAFFVSMGTKECIQKVQTKKLEASVISSAEFREQRVGEEMLAFVRTVSNPGEYIGIYFLETNFGYQNTQNTLSHKSFMSMKKKWKTQKEWDEYLHTMESIWNDVTYFPIPEMVTSPETTVTYENSWMNERTYGGTRGHEGTDLIPSKSERGLYPILSMTDGIVEKKGWNEKGGYRIGIKTEQGVYFYYAHLDSYANIQEGDKVKAGDILGFMGDSGYGPEGTTGQFVVHLHLGIYIYPDGVETSINPYWVLRYVENCKVKCYTEK